MPKYIVHFTLVYSHGELEELWIYKSSLLKPVPRIHLSVGGLCCSTFNMFFDLTISTYPVLWRFLLYKQRAIWTQLPRMAWLSFMLQLCTITVESAVYWQQRHVITLHTSTLHRSHSYVHSMQEVDLYIQVCMYRMRLHLIYVAVIVHMVTL